MKIGVFDSGIGGEKIAKLILQEFPNSDIVFISDKENLPYGNKTNQELLKLVKPKLKSLEKLGCDLIVIACNTVTTNIIKELRDYLNVPLVGFEPMVKPASEITKTGIITVCATPATLRSARYKKLKNTYAKKHKILEPDCSNWASLIEKDEISIGDIEDIVINSIDQGSDVIVLGCTHYHWIEEIVIKISNGRATVVQPEQAIINRIKSISK